MKRILLLSASLVLNSAVVEAAAPNAHEAQAREITRIEAHRFPVMANDLTRAYLGAVGRTMAGVEGDAAAAEVLAARPEFVDTTRTTCVATLLEGGHAGNALPQKATTTVNSRIFPGVPILPYLESGGTDGIVYRLAGIPTFASSGLFARPSEKYAHGLNERLTVKSFYEGLDRVFELATELGGVGRVGP